MAELVVLQDRRAKLTEGQDRVVAQLEVLLKRARQGQIRGLVYATISAEEPDIALGVLNTEGCGYHELIGISNMLSDRLLQVVRDIED